MTRNTLPAPPAQDSPGAELIGRGMAVRQIRTAYATAVEVQKPRHLPTVKKRLLDEARLAGEEFYYGWGAGKSAVEGPSIDLAVAAARCWGNCATEMLPVQEEADSWIFTAAFIDLETGYTRMRQFRQSKRWQVHGSMDAERKEDIRFQIGQSKAERNVILKAMPKWLIDDAVQAAKEGVKDKIEKYVASKGLPAATDMILRALAKCGVKEEAVLRKCNVAEKKGLQIDDLVILRGDLHALENGQERPESLFPAEEAEAPPKPAKRPGKDNAAHWQEQAASQANDPAEEEDHGEAWEGESDPQPAPA